MKVIETTGIKQLSKLCPGGVVSIGNFDGIHIGHRKILETANNIARRTKKPFHLVTFEPHPAAVLNPENNPGTITPLNVKTAILSSYGVDNLIIFSKSLEVLEMEPEDFVTQFIEKKAAASVVVEGHDFNFGRSRRGDVALLRALSGKKGFEVLEVEPQLVRCTDNTQVRVSSSLIRKFLLEGRVKDVCLGLGRRYSLFGRVVSGKGKGKKLGFPTLNMAPPEQIIPREGVYAGYVKTGSEDNPVNISGDYVPAAISIGTARTYGKGNPLLVEAHILHESPPEETQSMVIDFLQRIRDQRHFDSEQQLAAQISEDCAVMRELTASGI